MTTPDFWSALFAAVPPTIAAIGGIFYTWWTSRAAKTDRAITAETVDKIHTAVNSERTAMLERLEAMHAEILLLKAAAMRQDLNAP